MDDLAFPRVPPRLLDQLVDRLDPEEIWLFGSRTTGTAGVESDYDLLVVVRDDGAGVAVDVIPCRRAELRRPRIGLAR